MYGSPDDSFSLNLTMIIRIIFHHFEKSVFLARKRCYYKGASLNKLACKYDSDASFSLKTLIKSQQRVFSQYDDVSYQIRTLLDLYMLLSPTDPPPTVHVIVARLCTLIMDTFRVHACTLLRSYVGAADRD